MSTLDIRDASLRQEIAHRVFCEFSEMPSVRLTLPQAMRLFNLPRDVCSRILHSMVSDGLLVCRTDGVYMLAGSSV